MDFAASIAEKTREISRAFSRQYEVIIMALGGPEALGGPVALRRIYGAGLDQREEYVSADDTVLGWSRMWFDGMAVRLDAGFGPVPYSARDAATDA